MSTDTRGHDSSKPAPRLQLLVVDDDDLVIASLRTLLPAGWHPVPGFGCDNSELGKLALSCSAALIDMHLSRNLEQAEGLAILHTLHHIHPTLELIAMSGDLDRSSAAGRAPASTPPGRPPPHPHTAGSPTDSLLKQLLV